MKRKNKRIVVALILVLCIGGAGYGIVTTLGPKWLQADGPPSESPPSGGPGAGMARDEALPVRVAEAEPGNIRRYIKVNGGVVAKRRVNVYAAVSGKLVSMEAEAGDFVGKEQVLAYVDPSRPGESYTASPVKASITGTIISVPVNVGDMITPQTALAVIGDLRDLQIETFIPERFVASLRNGQPAEVLFEAFPGEQFSARVTEIDPILDQTSRSLGITLALNRRDPRVRAGMFASIELTMGSRTAVLTVPRDAVVRYYGETVVYVVDSEGTAHRRSVTLGLEGENNYEILTGLEEGERIVTEGQNFLSDKDHVRVIE